MLVLALSAKEVPPARDGLVFGARSSPRYSPFCDPFLLSGRVPPNQAAPSRGLFCERDSAPLCSVQHFPPRVARPRRFFGGAVTPPILPFAAPPPSLAVFPATKRRLYRGPPRATKVQQLLIFGVPPSPGEAAQGGGGLLPTSVRQGVSARFSPGFRVLSQKRGRRGLARGVFRFLRGIPPPAM